MERKNAGYKIIDSVTVGRTEFVLGQHPTAPSQFVTWECTAGGTDYIWGHYFSNPLDAKTDLAQRVLQETEILKQQQKEISQLTRKSETPTKQKNLIPER